jgi:hypothetical protein
MISRRRWFRVAISPSYENVPGSQRDAKRAIRMPVAGSRDRRGTPFMLST